MRIIKFAAIALIAALATQTNAVELDTEPAKKVTGNGRRFGNDLAADIAAWNELEDNMDWTPLHWAKARAMVDIYGHGGPVKPESKVKAMAAATERRIIMNLHDKVTDGTATPAEVQKYDDMKEESADLYWWVTKAKENKEYLRLIKKYNL